MWGAEFAWKEENIEQAILETEDLVLTYNGELISALFFSTSNGNTENAEEYWKNPLPYLKSVSSLGDLQSPKYKRTKQFTLEAFNEKLGVNVSQGARLLSSVTRTTGRAIDLVKIGGVSFTGREVREALGLYSSDFLMAWEGAEIAVTCKGFGHQVGMSQYGANEMAKSGSGFQQILTHYYTGVNVEPGMSFFVDGKI